jgi:hypothetical protein
MSNHNNLSGHILPTSGAMLGVCMTVISIVKLTQTNRGIAYWVDDLLALDALIFLGSSIFSYLSIRSKSKKFYFEDIADKVFMLALVLMGASVLLLTFEIV